MLNIRINMKKYILGSLAAASLILGGCSNGEEFNDAVFITGTLTTNTIRVAVDGVSHTAFTVTSSAKAASDIKIEVAAAPELLDEYNKKNQRNFQVPPVDAYTLEDGIVTIKSGSNVSSQASLVTDGDKLAEGISYCLPITIKEISGAGLDIMESSRTAYVMFTKVINIKAANLARRGGFNVPQFWEVNNPNSPVKALGEMTLEMKVLPVAFGTNPRNGNDISSLCGCEENFLFRFGDGAGQPTNQLQLAPGKIGTDPSDPNKNPNYGFKVTDKLFETGHWLHFAAVYDGSTLKIYLDGEQIYNVNTKGGIVNLSRAYDGHTWEDGFSIGRSAGYARYFNGYISECRVWNVARTLDELNAGICYVDPTTDGLVAYWRFNGETQDANGTVRDETGHGYDAVPFGSVTYVDNQKCPY